jgi:hypothetical protein
MYDSQRGTTRQAEVKQTQKLDTFGIIAIIVHILSKLRKRCIIAIDHIEVAFIMDI